MIINVEQLIYPQLGNLLRFIFNHIINIMDIIKLLQSRYPTKVYDPSFRLSEEQLATIKEVLRLSPSSINSQPWAFELIDDKALKSVLAEESWSNLERVKQASLLIVFYTYRDVETFIKERIDTQETPAQAQTYFHNYVASQGSEAIQAWQTHQIYIALGVLLTSLASMGLDSTPMEGIDVDKYDKILGREKYRPVLAVLVGRHAEDDFNHPSRKSKQRRNDVIL